MKIGELARNSGVSQRSLRYYEAKGLLAPQRTHSGHRVFTPLDVRRVRVIRRLFAAGFCSAVIGDLLPRILEPAEGDAHVVRDRFAAARRRLLSEIGAIRTELMTLDRLEGHLGLEHDMQVKDDDGLYERVESSRTTEIDHRSRRLR